MLYVFACFYLFPRHSKKCVSQIVGEIMPQTFHMCALFPLLWFPDALIGTASCAMYGGPVVQDENMIPIGVCLYSTSWEG